MPDFHDLPRPFWVLFAGTLVNRVGGFVLIFLAIYLTEERGLNPAQAGAVVAAYGIGAIGAGPIGGALSDRIGRRPTLVAMQPIAGEIVRKRSRPLVLALASLVLGVGFGLNAWVGTALGYPGPSPCGQSERSCLRRHRRRSSRIWHRLTYAVGIKARSQ